jgi:Cytochrome P460
MLLISVVLAVSAGSAISPQDKYTVQVPGGLSLSDCRGYEDWTEVAASVPQGKVNVIVANPSMIDAYRAGFPGNGKQVPDGSKIMKIAYKSKKNVESPFPVDVPDNVLGLGCMVKDSKRFADSGGWGWGAFNYAAASDTFTPATLADNPPQANDAKCGFACHTIVKAKDYVFTAYPKR